MIGSSLGHYQIVEKLGKGGMGEVFVAEDTKLHRRVALKILPEKFAKSSSRRERFEREARAVAKLDHPNIVTIFSVEESDGIHFITMQLLDGELLSSRIPPNGMDLPELLSTALPLADALAAAHAKGITHRDIKPKNIVITQDGTVKVLDFGLAKMDSLEASAAETEVETLELTEPGMIMGTASYMSPEQLQGEPIDSRSDIFSLGVVLYEMATGRRPFRGRTPIAVASSILKDKPQPISEFRKDLPPELSHIVARCLEVGTDQRFQTAAEVRDALEDLRQTTETGGSLITGLQRAVGAARPRTRALMAGALLLLALAAVLLWALRSGPGPGGRSSAPKKIVVLPLENMGPETEEYFAAGITDEITSRLASVSGLQVTSRTSAMQYRGDRPSVRDIGRELGVDYILEGTVRWSGLGREDSQVRITPKLVRVTDDTQIWAQPFTFDIDDIFSVQTQIAESVVTQLGTTLLEPERETIRARSTDNIAAYQAYLEGIYRVRRPVYRPEYWSAAVDSFQRAVELDPGFATAWAELATAHAYIDFLWPDPSGERKAAAERAVRRAAELQPDASETHLALAHYYYMVERNYDRALAELDLAERDRALAVEVLKSRGYILRRKGSWPQAVDALERALKLDPRDATAAAEVAESYEAIRDYDQAIRYYHQSIALDPTQTYSYYSAARAHWLSGDPLESSRELLERMPESDEPAPLVHRFWQEIYEGSYEAALALLASSPLDELEDWDGYRRRSSLEAQVARMLGREGAARDGFERARDALEREVAAEPTDWRRHSALGVAYAGLGLSDYAKRAGRRAVELLPLSRDAYTGTTPLVELALILTMLGEYDAAFDELERLLEIPATVSIELLRLDPRWQPLLDEPRFAALEARFREPDAVRTAT